MDSTTLSTVAHIGYRGQNAAATSMILYRPRSAIRNPDSWLEVSAILLRAYLLTPYCAAISNLLGDRSHLADDLRVWVAPRITTSLYITHSLPKSRTKAIINTLITHNQPAAGELKK